VELTSDPAKLEEEREFARKNKDKFKGFSNSDPTPWAQYSGFGSKDMEKMGGADAYRQGGQYDPCKKESIFAENKTKPEKKDGGDKEKDKKKKKHHKKKKESSSSSSESSESDEDESEGEEEKPKKFKKKKQGGLTKPPKKGDK